VDGGDVLDDGQAQAGPAGLAAPRRVDPVEALEDAFQVPARDPDALIADGDLDQIADRMRGDRDPGPVRAVVDRVLDQVADRDGQLVLAAQHLQPRVDPHHQRDRAVLRVHPAAVHRLLDHVADVHRAGVLQRVVALQPRQLDDLLHQPAQPGRLHPHPAGEPLHRLGVVGRLRDGVGEQHQGADRGLELVTHVDHEVAPDGVEPALPGAVLDQHQHQLAAQRGDPGAHVLRRAEPAPDDLQVLLADLAVTAHRPHHGQHLVDDQPLAADDAEYVGGRTGLQHLVLGPHHHGRRPQGGQHRRDAGRDDGRG
jgi:hypothetical protein